MAVRTFFFLMSLLLPFFAVGSPAAANETATKAPLIIVINADFSTVAVEGGNAIAQGVQLAVNELNQAGGILGRPLQVIHKDHRGNPGRGLANLQSLVKLDNLLAVMGGVHTPVAIAELGTVHQHDLLYLSPWAAGTPLVDNGFEPNNVFRVSIRDSEAAEVLIRHAKAMGHQRIALALERTGWGRSNVTSLTQAAQQQGIEIVKITWINWQQSTFLQDAQAIADSAATAVILVANAPEGATITRALHQVMGDNMPVISHWGIGSGNFKNLVGSSILASMDISVIQTFSFLHQTHARAQHLYQAYAQAYGPVAHKHVVPAVVGLAHAYDLVHLLALAAKQAGTTEAANLRVALEQLPPYQGAVKTYAPAFSHARHDALWADDYFMAKLDKNGHLIPIQR